jgi:hypothetical protein
VPYRSDLGVNQFAYRDKKVVGVFVRFRALNLIYNQF